MKEKHIVTKSIIIVALTCLIIGGFIGYFLHPSLNRNFMQRNNNFQLSEESKKEIISFFENTKDANEINNYCKEHIVDCAYYCREINPNHEACKNLPQRTPQFNKV